MEEQFNLGTWYLGLPPFATAIDIYLKFCELLFYIQDNMIPDVIFLQELFWTIHWILIVWGAGGIIALLVSPIFICSWISIKLKNYIRSNILGNKKEEEI